MTLVAATTTSPVGAPGGGVPDLQEWALEVSGVYERLAAIELVLTHDFDEPFPAHSPGLSRETAQRLREDFLLQTIGIGQARRARPLRLAETPSHAADASLTAAA